MKIGRIEIKASRSDNGAATEEVVSDLMKIAVNREYQDKAGNVWKVLRLLPGGKAELLCEARSRYVGMRYCDIRHNMTPA